MDCLLLGWISVADPTGHEALQALLGLKPHFNLIAAKLMVLGCSAQATGYPAMREVIAETLRYVTPMGFDVLTHLMIDHMASPHREKLHRVRTIVTCDLLPGHMTH